MSHSKAFKCIVMEPSQYALDDGVSLPRVHRAGTFKYDLLN